ncbi:MAG: regulatory protein RecX [Firmicutes bacterium]|nr:regulatory protein RecX [Bacillota bacterium]
MNRAEEALKAAVEILGRRGASVAEIEAALKRKGFAGEEIREAESRLKELGYLDDERFATEWASLRAGGGSGVARLGANGLRAGLIGRGIEPRLAAEVSETVMPPDAETRAALEVASRRLRVYSRLDRETQERRLWSYLARRGFRPAAIARALAETLNVTDGDMGET